jgi:hypothetical protein
VSLATPRPLVCLPQFFRAHTEICDSTRTSTKVRGDVYDANNNKLGPLVTVNTGSPHGDASLATFYYEPLQRIVGISSYLNNSVNAVGSAEGYLGEANIGVAFESDNCTGTPYVSVNANVYTTFNSVANAVLSSGTDLYKLKKM